MSLFLKNNFTKIRVAVSDVLLNVKDFFRKMKNSQIISKNVISLKK